MGIGGSNLYKKKKKQQTNKTKQQRQKNIFLFFGAVFEKFVLRDNNALIQFIRCTSR